MFSGELSAEEKKAKLRKYLEDTGLIKAITDVFDKLILAKDKPEDPMHFVLQEMGGSIPSQETIDQLEMELEETNREIDKLTKILEDLNGGEIPKDKKDASDAGPSCSAGN